MDEQAVEEKVFHPDFPADAKGLQILLPYTRWKKEQKNLKPGDVVLMRYEGNVKDDYRLAMVEEIHPDAKGLVRTVTVKFRKRNKKESKTVCKPGNLIKEKVAVQRGHFLASANDEHQS